MEKTHGRTIRMAGQEERKHRMTIRKGRSLWKETPN